MMQPDFDSPPSSIPGSDIFPELAHPNFHPETPSAQELREEESPVTLLSPVSETLLQSEKNRTPHPTMQEAAISGVQAIPQDTEESATLEDTGPQTKRSGTYHHNHLFTYEPPAIEPFPPPTSPSIEWARNSQQKEWERRYDEWESRQWLAEERGQPFNEPPPPHPFHHTEEKNPTSSSYNVQTTDFHKDDQNVA